MADLLFISHRVPYPPDKGDKIRSWHFLKRLATRYRVHLAAFVDDPADFQHEATLREVCHSVGLVPLHPTWAKVRSLQAFPAGEPLTVPYFRDARLARFVDRIGAEFSPGHVFAFSSGVAAYAMNGRFAGARKVLDMVDVDSDKWRQYADRHSGLMRWVYRREARQLLAFEKRASAAFDATILVSEAEAELYRGLAPEAASDTFAIENGVDAEFFDPAIAQDDPYGGNGAGTMVFTGAMDYWPNVDAVVWFAEEVFPGIRAARPDAAFCIVGGKPAKEVQALAERPGISVTGRVPDVRPYIAHAGLVVAPLRVARGVQNKVLEGMAMAKTVLASPMALEGIDAEAGRELRVADAAPDFAAAALDAMENPDPAMGEKARRRVVECYSWEAGFGRLQSLIAS
ncbi:TIGR03087 family PEP-CTERM/XrtA system glycosyltransferase [Oceanibacterium hippocampi]|uniref:Uncharacterized protein n=1 Tax=Oceanibacterium hippocampi TaxID=745714 RepID=A0A1Y5TPS1_9PROT|nr:TIGR03087 family PEP-CTERM/XrtA system glycosyltransferase [Oceanibacterium hippocampi]SLN69070.1 hypothetical protein OCH7691_03152 [Oceanibacterium hippocampi]